MSKKTFKIFILIPDGVSLRNFAYTHFYKLAASKGVEVVFWHHTPFDLDALGFQNLTLEHPKSHWLTTVLKNVRKRVEISCFAKQEKDPIYYRYLFPLSNIGFKNIVRSLLTQFLTFCFNSEYGLRLIRAAIVKLEQRTSFYKHCKTVLQTHKPDLVYCTSQRSVLAIAPLEGAKQLGIPTVCFIFSWDNLPKATLDVTTDYYHVWSEHMKQELLKYYSFINESQITVTGTPQFEPHFDNPNRISKQEFYDIYNLDSKTTYLCYSGDDVTTSPKDELYLRDVAQAIRQLNTEGFKLGLIFRRCPVDFSDRYDAILKTYKDVIIPIEPIWVKIGGAWDTILPMPEDLHLLDNLATHSEAVINLGSSMVFDFVAHQKPCFYMNYNYLNANNHLEAGVYVYDYVHFRSKPNNEVVIWFNHPDEIANQIKGMLKNSSVTVANATQWFEKINAMPYHLASQRILDTISQLTYKTK